MISRVQFFELPPVSGSGLMKLSQSVGQYGRQLVGKWTVFLKSDTEFFQNFKLTFQGTKFFQSWVFQKSSHFWEKTQNSSKIDFFDFYQKFYPLVSFFTLEMAHNSVFYDSLKTQLLEKVWFFSYGLKCSELIRLYYSLIISIFGKNQLISQIFCIEVIIKKR